MNLAAIVWLGASLFSGAPCPADKSLFVEVDGVVQAKLWFPGQCRSVPRDATVRAICVGPNESGTALEALGPWTPMGHALERYAGEEYIPCYLKRPVR